MLFKREKKDHSVKSHLQQARKRQGFCDLLGYLFLLDEQTIVHRDGALSRHFRYLPPDLDAVTVEGLELHTEVWRQALSLLGDNWVIETNVITREVSTYPKPQVFPELVSALIDDEQRLACEHEGYFRTEYYLSLTWLPANQTNRLSKWRRKSVKMLEPNEQTLARFQQHCSEFIGILSKSFEAYALKDDELISYLYQCITHANQTLKSPYIGAFLQSYLAHDFIAGSNPKIDNRFIKVISIDDYPALSHPNLLGVLCRLPIACRWSSRFFPMDKSSTKQCLNSRERSWSSQSIGGAAGVFRESLGLPIKQNQDAEQTFLDIRDAQTQNSAGLRQYGYHNNTIIVIGNDLDSLNKQVEILVNYIQQLEFKARIESYNATEAYLGSLPSHGDYNLRKILVDTTYLSHALPISGVYQGNEMAPCPYYGRKQPPLLFTETSGSRPFWLNLHVGDVGHTAVLGPTGSGKSTLIGALIAAHRKYAGSRIIVIDKDLSHQSLIKALDGTYISSFSETAQLAPFANLDSTKPSSIDKVVQWLSNCCAIQDVSMTPARLKHLRESVTAMADEQPSYRNLQHLSVQDPEIRQAIQTYCQGRFAQLLNGVQSMFRGNTVIGVDMTELIQPFGKSQDLHMPVIEAVLNEVESLFEDKVPTLLVLEEAWLYLKHPLFIPKLQDWFKTLRKSNVAVIFISQDLSDIATNEAASVIQNSCMTRIYLPNQSAKEPAVRKFYEDFGLNEPQIEQIQQALPKQDYYYQSPLGCRLFRLNLGELAQAFLCISSKDETDQFNALYSKDNIHWIYDWLQFKGLGEWAEHIDQQYMTQVSNG